MKLYRRELLSLINDTDDVIQVTSDTTKFHAHCHHVFQKALEKGGINWEDLKQGFEKWKKKLSTTEVAASVKLE